MAPVPRLNHGPLFPYRFSFAPSQLRQRQIPSDLGGHSFCRWTIGDHPRALDWNDQGKGKGPTALSTDTPPRCCSERTPQLCIIDDIAGIAGPGGVYLAIVAGPGWYSTTPERDFIVRLVTNEHDVPLLRKEALLYAEAWSSREPLRKENGVDPLEFYGFFQTDARDAAAIVLEYRGTPRRAKS